MVDVYLWINLLNVFVIRDILVNFVKWRWIFVLIIIVSMGSV